MDQGRWCCNVGSVLSISYSGEKVPLCRWAMRFLNETSAASLGLHWTVWNTPSPLFPRVHLPLPSPEWLPRSCSCGCLTQVMNGAALLWFLLSSTSDSSSWEEGNFGGFSVTWTVFNNYFHLNSHVVRMEGAQLATVFLTICFGFKCGFIPLLPTHFGIIC